LSIAKDFALFLKKSWGRGLGAKGGISFALLKADQEEIKRSFLGKIRPAWVSRL